MTPPTGASAYMAEKITLGSDGVLRVPDEPIIPFVEGDGIGIDIWPAARSVLDAAAAKHGVSPDSWGLAGHYCGIGTSISSDAFGEVLLSEGDEVR